MERQRIGRLKWYDLGFWVIGITILSFSLWVLSHYWELPHEVCVVYIIFAGLGLIISLLNMRTILEFDGEFLYLISIHFFVRKVSRRIKINDITRIEFMPDFWYRGAMWDFLRYKFAELPEEERTVWNFVCMAEVFGYKSFGNCLFGNKEYYDVEEAKIPYVFKHFKVRIMYGGKKVSFGVERNEAVADYMIHLKENLISCETGEILQNG